MGSREFFLLLIMLCTDAGIFWQYTKDNDLLWFAFIVAVTVWMLYLIIGGNRKQRVLKQQIKKIQKEQEKNKQ